MIKEIWKTDDLILKDRILSCLMISYPQYSFDYKDGCFLVVGDSTDIEISDMSSLAKIVAYSISAMDEGDLFDHVNDGELRSEDVNKWALETGQVTWLAPGLAAYEGDFLAVKNAISEKWRQISLDVFSAHEIENPGIWSNKIIRETKYLEDFPHEAMLIIGAKKNSKSLISYSENIKGLEDEFLSGISSESTLLGCCQPSVCTSCYFVASTKAYERKIYTTYNRVFRNEGGYDLSRLSSFTVRDIMVVGDSEYVLSVRSRFISVFSSLLAALDLRSRIIQANDPFFGRASKKMYVQNAGALKHEAVAYIPNSNSWLAVGSVNYHLNSFGSAFGIRDADMIAHSACVGLGMERAAFALFSQFGTNVDRWPNKVKDYLCI